MVKSASLVAICGLWALCLLGCGGQEPVSADASVRFVLSDEVPAFADVPFPSELYRDAEGRIAIGAFPNSHTDGAMFAAVRELLSRRDGFCASCNITFAIDGGLGGGALTRGAALIDIDPDSSERGRSFPLRLQWHAEQGLLSMRPARGYVLHGGRRYAAVLTSDLFGDNGRALVAAPDFAALRDGAGADDPVSERARAVIEPALSALETLGMARQRVVGLAVFTTEDPSQELIRLRERVQQAPAPVADVDAVFSGAQLDELLGIPETPGSGVDLRPAATSAGTRAVAHETTALVVAGHMSAPRFVQGTGSDVGVITRDEAGWPSSESVDEVPYILIVPSGVDVSRLPVVVAQHGFNSSRTTGFAIADTAGRAGYAVLAIDAFQHGDRAATAVDERHALRGDYQGADGFAENEMLEVSSRMFGLSGGADGMALFPGYALAAFEQFAADVMTSTRLLSEGDLDALRAAHPMLSELAFDTDHIAYVGNSMGAVVGAGVVMAEPDISAAVLNVLPGSIVETLCESGEFRPLTTTLLLPVVGVTGPFDEEVRALVFDPTVDLIRWVLEPVDPLALAPYIARDRRAAAGPLPDVLIQLAGHDEVAAPTASESVVAAAGIAGAGDFGFAEVEPVGLPVQGTDATVAAVRFEGAMHGMMEVHEQSSHFEAPLAPPLSPRNMLLVSNPTDRVHQQIEAFLRSAAEEGRAVIIP